MKRVGADPANASGIFLTTVTDAASVGLLLGLGTVLLLRRNYFRALSVFIAATSSFEPEPHRETDWSACVKGMSRG
jgi:hypothetical protein